MSPHPLLTWARQLVSGPFPFRPIQWIDRAWLFDEVRRRVAGATLPGQLVQNNPFALSRIEAMEAFLHVFHPGSDRLRTAWKTYPFATRPRCDSGRTGPLPVLMVQSNNSALSLVSTRRSMLQKARSPSYLTQARYHRFSDRTI